MQKEKQIKSRKRVRELGEVYTNIREVKAMCDLIPSQVWNKLNSTFLEPACGNGNFLEEILRRKINLFEDKDESLDGKQLEFYTLVALSSIYGIDIDKKNVLEARERLASIVVEILQSPGEKFLKAQEKLLQFNIIRGNFLNPKRVYIHEWDTKEEGVLKSKVFLLEHMFPVRDDLLINIFASPLKGKGEIIKLY